mgnify:CR=1 FL=1
MTGSHGIELHVQDSGTTLILTQHERSSECDEDEYFELKWSQEMRFNRRVDRLDSVEAKVVEVALGVRFSDEKKEVRENTAGRLVLEK